MDDAPQEHIHLIPENLRDIINELEPLVLEMLGEQQHILAGQLSEGQIKTLIDGLPQIDEKKLVELGEKDSSCPICYTPYLAIIAEEELALAMDSPARPIEELGVTKLSKSWQCNHMFCRRDISKWIIGGHDSCPLCRRLLVERQEPAKVDAPSEGSTSRDEGNPSPEPEPESLHPRRTGTLDIGGYSFDALRLGPIRRANLSTNDDDRREYSGMYS